MSLLTIDREKCAKDGMCVNECPARIIEMVDEESFPQLIAGGEEFCINCGHCVAVCPRGAAALDWMDPEACVPVRKDLVPEFERVDHFLRSRRSIRSYKEQPVDRDTLNSILDTARYAPSGHNYQPVHWLVFYEREQVSRLAGLVIDWMRAMIRAKTEIAQSLHFDRVLHAWEAGIDRVLRGAPHLIVAHGPANLPAAQPASIIALTYLELAAYAHNLGACWAGYFNTAANLYPPLQKALALPEGHLTFGGMMVGHAKYKYFRIPLRNDARIEWR